MIYTTSLLECTWGLSIKVSVMSSTKYKWDLSVFTLFSTSIPRFFIHFISRGHAILYWSFRHLISGINYPYYMLLDQVITQTFLNPLYERIKRTATGPQFDYRCRPDARYEVIRVDFRCTLTMLGDSLFLNSKCICKCLMDKVFIARIS